ncbi:D-alanyl-D-alanine carboxypeptidase family protein [Alteraurantiacibacter aquimixticola]|uniref:serine-type D-Ala-D-Ala carboxypeptidase n=1 Tax=Alteraurantiacibacter aquimixticola TaxID=2489173 RepID=A0A4T3F5F3_9SPHN|nr:D-alanyl-D-alanine carboxypeptidase family protein [Alteraurantiacibacter aquimixticola]TIX50056.1 D-alanyl-D-alanine carboxypeptidase [Alteraurantiacibacter aquimixticola]
MAIFARVSGILLSGALLAASPAASASAPAPVPVEVPIALIVDISTGQTLFAREEERRFVPASVVKVMTAYTAFGLIEEGRITPATPFQVSQELADEWSGEGSTMFLKAGDRPTFGELLLGATTVSGNDASVAIAMATTGSLESWIALMNANAAELGMRNTHFGSANGYPDEGRTFTSARDLAVLAEALVTRHPDLYRRYFGRRTFSWNGITQQNHEPLTGRVEGADGIKTGFTNEAGNTLVGSGERDGRRLVLVLAGVADYDMRGDVGRALLEWGFSDFETRPLAGAGTPMGTALVQDGASSRVSLRLPRDLALSLPLDSNGAITAAIRYNGPLMAPIAEGDTVAQLRVSVEGMEPFDVPLEAAENVGEANFLQRIVNGLRGLFT